MRKLSQRLLSQELVIRFAPGLRRKMLSSVGRLPPEEYGLLVGDLERPFDVLELRPMPPAANTTGRAQRSAASVTLNAPFIEYYLNTEVIPFGHFFLGAIHSHPGSMTSLSGGNPGSGRGDIPSMRGQLEAAQRMGYPWEYYIAPIVTHPGDDPVVTGWILHLDYPEPIPAKIVWEEAQGLISAVGPSSEAVVPAASHTNSIATPAFPIDALVACHRAYQSPIAGLLNDDTIADADKAPIVDQLRRLCKADLNAKTAGLLKSDRMGPPAVGGGMAGPAPAPSGGLH